MTARRPLALALLLALAAPVRALTPVPDVSGTFIRVLKRLEGVPWRLIRCDAADPDQVALEIKAPVDLGANQALQRMALEPPRVVVGGSEGESSIELRARYLRRPPPAAPPGQGLGDLVGLIDAYRETLHGDDLTLSAPKDATTTDGSPSWTAFVCYTAEVTDERTVPLLLRQLRRDARWFRVTQILVRRTEERFPLRIEGELCTLRLQPSPPDAEPTLALEKLLKDQTVGVAAPPPGGGRRLTFTGRLPRDMPLSGVLRAVLESPGLAAWESLRYQFQKNVVIDFDVRFLAPEASAPDASSSTSSAP